MQMMRFSVLIALTWMVGVQSDSHGSGRPSEGEKPAGPPPPPTVVVPIPGPPAPGQVNKSEDCPPRTGREWVCRVRLLYQQKSETLKTEKHLSH